MSEFFATDIAQAIADVIEALPLDPPIRAYIDPPATIAKLPAAVVDLPDFGRREEEEGESEVGSYDWHLTYPVGIYYELNEAGKAHRQIRQAAELFIKAIDQSHELGALVTDVVVSGARPEYELGGSRALIIYECTVKVFCIVPNPQYPFN